MQYTKRREELKKKKEGRKEKGEERKGKRKERKKKPTNICILGLSVYLRKEHQTICNLKISTQ